MKRLGILGNGQLGAMIAIAARPLGIVCEFLGEEPTLTCDGLGSQTFYKDNRPASVSAFAANVDLLTYESENISIGDLSKTDPSKIFPNVKALKVTQDRLLEKELCQKLGVPTAPFSAVSTFEELKAAASRTGYPSILKTRTLGYDGKGQWKITSDGDLNDLGDKIDWHLNKYILEGHIDFLREISIIGVRGRDGETALYPVAENRHSAGILRRSKVLLSDPQQFAAESIFKKIASFFDYVGVLTVELFDCGDRLLVNELAPRVHNSGHWTIEGAATSQFENHVRAICGMPLGSTLARSNAEMHNIISQHINRTAVLKIPGAHFHDYRKSARENRKLGHVTITEMDTTDYKMSCADFERLLIAATEGK